MIAGSTLLRFVQDILSDMKTQNVVVLPVAEMTTVTDYMVIATGTSTTQIRATIDRLLERARREEIPVLSSGGDQQAEWCIVDFGDVILHLMKPSVREYFQLEKLWSVDECAVGS